MQKNENNLQHWIDNQPEGAMSSVITIPVVVHVVYYNSNENISTAQVQSQIDILNEDFKRFILSFVRNRRRKKLKNLDRRTAFIKDHYISRINSRGLCSTNCYDCFNIALKL